MIRKITAVVVSISFALCLFASCGKSEEPQTSTTSNTITETTEPTTQPIIGTGFSNEDTIKMSNYMNAGKIAYSGSWIYGESLLNTRFALSKIKEDNSDENFLSDDTPLFINVAGNWVYFVGMNPDLQFSVKKVRLSGEEETTLIKAEEWHQINGMQIYGDKIFFNERSLFEDDDVKGSFCCSDLEGKNKEILINKTVNSPYIINGFILYQDRDDNEKLHICKIDGSDDKVLIDKPVQKYIIYGSSIFYVSLDSSCLDEEGNIVNHKNYQLRKCDLDGSNDSLYMDVNNTDYTFAIINDILYYSDRNDGGRLYSIDLKTESVDLIGQDQNVSYVLSLYPSNKILYYVTDEDLHTKNVYVSNSDGTGKYDILK